MDADQWSYGPALPSHVDDLKGRGLSYNGEIYYLSRPGQVYRLDTDSWTEVASLSTLEPMSFSGQVFSAEILQCGQKGNIFNHLIYL